MNEKLLIFKKLFVFLGIVVLLDQVIGTVLKKLYFSTKSGDDYLMTYTLNELKSDVLIIGSSRAHHHYNAPMMADSLHLSVFNAGRDGCFMFYSYAVLKSALHRYHPKAIILDVLPNEFERSDVDYDRLSFLLPYYDSHPEIRSICQLKSKYERVKLLSKIYPYNSKLYQCIRSIFPFHENSVDGMKTNGYEPIDRKLIQSARVREKVKPIDSLKVEVFEKFIHECQQSNVKLIVNVSPVFMDFTDARKSLDIERRICLANHVPFFDYTDDREFSESTLFANDSHLNRAGALKFSKLYIQDIKSLLN